jgi:isopropylmalate/homocitrate/citramalate synthase
MRGPHTVSLDGLPDRVTIYEVGPRDGLQNESTIVPAEVKAEFINRLADAWLRMVEATSFVHADSATGNLATEDLVWQLNGLGIDTGVELPRLVATSVWMADQLGRPSPSRAVQALAPQAKE